MEGLSFTSIFRRSNEKEEEEVLDLVTARCTHDWLILGIDEVNNATLSLEEALEDNKRVDYFRGHLSFLLQAIK